MSAMTQAARAAQRAMYTPRPRAAAPKPVRESAVDIKLRKLVGKVLDDLKLPTAVPSKVIESALREARDL